MQKQPTKIEVDIIVLTNNEILLGKRRNCNGEGDWGLAGRHLGYKEKLLDAALSMLKYSFNIEGRQIDLNFVSEDIMSKDHIVYCVFTLDIGEEHIIPMVSDKCSEWKFFNINNLPKNIYKAHKKIINTFLSGKTYLYE